MGIITMMSTAVNPRIPLEWYILPRRSANVDAPYSLPLRLVRPPKTRNATMSPTNRLRKHSHINDIPWTADCPPNPMTADAERKVEPYERARMTGPALLLPRRNSSLLLVFL